MPDVVEHNSVAEIVIHLDNDDWQRISRRSAALSRYQNRWIDPWYGSGLQWGLWSRD